jgi:hypothetical protein
MEIMLYERRHSNVMGFEHQHCGGEKQVQTFVVGILCKLKKEKVKNKNRTFKS